MWVLIVINLNIKMNYSLLWATLRQTLTHKCMCREVHIHLVLYWSCYYEGSRPDVFCKVFLKISQNSMENTCARVFFFKYRLATLLKKRYWHRFAKFLRTPFLKEHLWWLLLFYKTHNGPDFNVWPKFDTLKSHTSNTIPYQQWQWAILKLSFDTSVQD